MYPLRRFLTIPLIAGVVLLLAITSIVCALRLRNLAEEHQNFKDEVHVLLNKYLQLGQILTDRQERLETIMLTNGNLLLTRDNITAYNKTHACNSKTRSSAQAIGGP